MKLINTQNKEHVQLTSTNFSKPPVNLVNIDSDFLCPPDFREIQQKNCSLFVTENLLVSWKSGLELPCGRQFKIRFARVPWNVWHFDNKESLSSWNTPLKSCLLLPRTNSKDLALPITQPSLHISLHLNVWDPSLSLFLQLDNGFGRHRH